MLCTEGCIAVNSLAYYPDNTHAIHVNVWGFFFFFFQRDSVVKDVFTKSEVQKSHAQMLERVRICGCFNFGKKDCLSVVDFFFFRERFFSDDGESRKCFPWLLRRRKKRQYGTLCGNILWLKSCVFVVCGGWTEEGMGERKKGGRGNDGTTGVSFKARSFLIGSERRER